MLFIINLLLIISSLSFGANWYVSPNGSPAGDGSLANPWDLTTAFNAKDHALRGPVQPGDVMYLRGGRYPSPGAYIWWPTLTGSAATATAPRNPITIRSFPGDPRPALDLLNFYDSLIFDNPARSGNTLGHNVHDVDLWDIEIYSSNIVRASSLSGNNGMPNSLMFEGQNIRMIHCYVHDLGDLASFGPASNNQFYGNITMDHGWLAPDRGHGHLIYIENDNSNGSVKTFQNNFGFDSYDDGVQEFGTAALTRDINFLGNTIADSGGAAAVNSATIQWMIGQNNPTGIVTDGNMFFESPSLPGTGQVQAGWQWDTTNGKVQFTNNYVIGPEMDLDNWTTAIFTGNHIFPRSVNAIAFYLYGAANPVQSFKNWTIDNNTYGPGKFIVGSRTLDPNFNPITQSQTQQTTAQWQASISGDTNSTFNATPQAAILINPSTFIPGRVHISIWNPSGAANVPVDLTSAGLTDGAAYTLLDAQNFGGSPVMTGTYSAASPVVSLPATGLTRKTLIGVGTQPKHTAPYLLTFVLLSGQALDGTWNPIAGAALPPISTPIPPPVTQPSGPPAPGTPVSFVYFVANPNTSPLSTTGTATPVTLSWNVIGAVALALTGSDGLQGGGQPFSKNVAVTPKVINQTVTYTLTATDVSGVKTTATVQVAVGNAPPPTTTPAAVSVSVSGSPLSVGQAGVSQLTAGVSNASSAAVTWSISPNVGTLTSTGTSTATYTAPAAIASSSSVVVTATSTADTTKSASVTISLVPPAAPVVSIGLTATSLSLVGGASSQLTAAVAGSSNTAVTWTLSPQVGTLTTSGSTATYAAPASITSASTVTVTAMSVADPTKSSTATISLVPPATVVTQTSAVINAFTGVANNDGTLGFTWATDQAQVVAIMESDGVVASEVLSGSAKIVPKAKGGMVMATLVAIGSDGVAVNQSVTLQVTTPIVTPPVTAPTGAAVFNSFTGTVNADRTVTLVWNVTNATALMMNSTDGAYSNTNQKFVNTITITPNQATGPIRYDLYATAANGSVTPQSVTVTLP